MYSLSTPLLDVKGIGPQIATKLATIQLVTVKDFLLWLPLRYEDRSHLVTIQELKLNELVTLKGKVINSSNFYRGRRSIQNATVVDETGKLKLMWFNSPSLASRLVKDETYLISGKLNDRGMMVQPVVENLRDDTIHTNRLIPLYSAMPAIKQGTLRRILKHILDFLTPPSDIVYQLLEPAKLPDLGTALTQLHFPDTTEMIVTARERLALEELLSLMDKSKAIKQEWIDQGTAPTIAQPTGRQPTEPTNSSKTAQLTQVTLPFELTKAQVRVIGEVLQDLRQTIPMNRLLLGDVGSGKTVVAGVAAWEMIRAGHSVALIVPTRILADQHLATLEKLFPNMPRQLVITSPKKKTFTLSEQPTLYIGTHAVINRLSQIKPGLIIYDEQHRFGVTQRSYSGEEVNRSETSPKKSPHILTMSATPIPRSLMLTIFSHLSLSVIDELPQGRLPIKTWVVPQTKRASSLAWIDEQLGPVLPPAPTTDVPLSSQTPASNQALIVCPFIDPSRIEALENIAAVTQTHTEIQAAFPNRRVALLHGRLTKARQKEVTDQVYERSIDILVTTPIVEVGVDLPAAGIIVIEAADRFGLASLHQLRGRVGRAGQQAYCLVFSASQQPAAFDRLTKFSQITNGQALAELDLENRGAGDIFGTQQHGFDQLRFASWTNLELITLARTTFEKLHQLSPELAKWQPLFDMRQLATETTPLAN